MEPPTKRIRWRHLLALWVALSALPVASSWATTGKKTAAKKTSRGWPIALTLTPMLGLSDVEDVPVGAGLDAQFIASPLARFGVGIGVSWSSHGAANFLRAALLLQILIDDLAIHPFLQTGVGLQLRLQEGSLALSPDIHLGLGFDVPVLSWFTVGAAFRIYFPIDPQTFPVTKSLHLRLRLVF